MIKPDQDNRTGLTEGIQRILENMESVMRNLSKEVASLTEENQRLNRVAEHLEDSIRAISDAVTRADMPDRQTNHLRDGIRDPTNVDGDFARAMADINQKDLILKSREDDLSKLREEHESVVKELSAVREKVDTSYSAGELSEYLGSMIDDFNTNVNQSDLSLNYVINGMDVDLKAQVFKGENGGIKLSAADISSNSDSSLSTVKISIRAVPK